MSELDNRVSITVSISDVVVTRAGFGIPGIVHKHGVAAQARVATFTDLASLLLIYPSYTPVGKAATIMYSQAFTVAQVKVIKRETGETITQALDAAILVDDDFYGVCTPHRVNADLEAGAAWALANNRFFGYSTQDVVSIGALTTDPFSVIQALSNNRAAGWYSATAGLELAIVSIAVAGTVATATMAALPPVAIGDTVGIWNSAIPALNNVWTVVTVGALDFTFTVPAGTLPDAAASDAWANFNLLEFAAMGKMLPQDAGSKTWDLQLLSAVTPDRLTGTAQTNLGAKNANWFSTVGGLNITGGLKESGGITASGRHIDVQRGADWLEVNMQADLLELLVGEGGDLGYDALGFAKTESKIATRMNVGTNNGFLTTIVTGQYAGLPYKIVMPDITAIPTADKTNRLLSGIQIFGTIRGKIQWLEADITLST